MHIQHMTEMVSEWIEPLIPRSHRDSMDTCIKLTEEVSELMHAIHHGGDVAQECADVLVLLLDVALLNDVDLPTAFMEKMAINHKRVWKKKNGALKHEN